LNNENDIFSFGNLLENIAETASDESGFDEEEVLSFDRLREAFAELKQKETDSVSAFSLTDEPQLLSQDRLPGGSQTSTPFSNAETSLSETFQDSDNESEKKIGAEDDTKDSAQNIADTESYESISISEEERCEINPRTIFEAMLFVGDRENKPLAPESAAKLMRNVAPNELIEIADQLNAEYESVGAPYHIIRESGGFRMVLRPEYESIRTKFYGKVRGTRLSQAAIDALAVVAYKQPITADEVQKLRKSPSQSILQQLVRRGLLEPQRILQNKKNVTLFRTTDRFLQLFQLESLDDLPTAEEIDFR
jgi:segregation and condensation protein B